MAASLNELMKPTRFDVDPSSPKAAKQLKHWFRVFTDFAQKCDQIARAQDADAPYKLRMLFAYISADVYELIEDCWPWCGAHKTQKSLWKVSEGDFRDARFGDEKAKSWRVIADLFEWTACFKQSLQLSRCYCWGLQIWACSWCFHQPFEIPWNSSASIGK